MPAACMKSLTLTHEGWEFGFAKFPFDDTSVKQQLPQNVLAFCNAVAGFIDEAIKD